MFGCFTAQLFTSLMIMNLFISIVDMASNIYINIKLSKTHKHQHQIIDLGGILIVLMCITVNTFGIFFVCKHKLYIIAVKMTYIAHTLLLSIVLILFFVRIVGISPVTIASGLIILVNIVIIIGLYKETSTVTTIELTPKTVPV